MIEFNYCDMQRNELYGCEFNEKTFFNLTVISVHKRFLKDLF